jgi:predicted metal-dependent phosphotriesterase family hydrolase
VTGFVRTVLGDVPASELGITYVHEHVIIDSPLVSETMGHIHLPSVSEAVAEITLCADVGVGTMVDAMPAGSGRDVVRLAEASEQSGIHIVATTGMHTPKYYNDVSWAAADSAQQLAARFISDIETGVDRYDYRGTTVDRTDHRAGIIKIATPESQVTAWDRRVFSAGAIAAARTGVPILTHCEEGVGAQQQLALLSELGVDLHRVVISHTDKIADRQYHFDLLDAGVNLEYDQALRQGDGARHGTAGLLRDMIDAGFLGQLMLGTDGARRSLWSTLGGNPGLAWLASGFLDVLRSVGIGQAEQHVLFVDNPRAFLTLGETDRSVST